MPKKVKEMLFEEKKEVDDIEFKVDRITKTLLDKEPSYFSSKDVIRSFFGALFVGINFIFAGRLITVSLNLSFYNMIIILITDMLILTGGIYFIAYRRVVHKDERPFFQFWWKRLLIFYLISLGVSFFLIYLFGIPLEENIHSFYDVLRVVSIITVPASIGAASADLLKQY